MMYFLALLPIFILIVLSLWRGVRTAVFVSFAVTAGLFFYWGAGTTHFFASLMAALFSTVNILMIIFGALFLYGVMESAGLIAQITRSLEGIHPAREVRFYLLALGLTGFFEGVAGFGTPGAIVPLLLMAMGYGALLSVSVVLLLNGIFAVFGAVGTPIIAGLELPLGLAPNDINRVGQWGAMLMAAAGAVVMVGIFRLYVQLDSRMHFVRPVSIMYGLFAVSVIAFSFITRELPSVLGVVVMLAGAIALLYRGEGAIAWRPWVPYIVLVLLLLLPKFSADLRQAMAVPVGFADIRQTGIAAQLQPLRSPMIPFVLVALGVLAARRSRELHLGTALRKLGAVFIVLFPSIAISQLMLQAGVTQPSMVSYIAEVFGLLGTAYVAFAPFVGMMGAFITGSTTVSNIIFGASQMQTAHTIGVSPWLVLALQHVGAALGNAVCLFNIIAAASVAGLTDYRKVLLNNLPPAGLAALLAGLLGLAILLFLR